MQALPRIDELPATLREAVHALVGAGYVAFGANEAPPVWNDKAPPLAHGRIHDTVTHRGDIYVAHEAGLSRYDGATDTYKPVPTPDRPLEDRSADFVPTEERPGISRARYAMEATSDHAARVTLVSSGDDLFIVGGVVLDTAKKTFDRQPSPSVSLERDRTAKLTRHRTVGEVWRHDGDDAVLLPNGMVPRADAAAATVGGKLYVVGGFDKNDASPRDENVAALDVAQVFDPKSGRWTTLPPLPEPRWGATALEVDGKLFVIGGRDDEKASRRIDVFDPKCNAWQDPPLELRFGRTGATAWVDDGELHVALGHTGEDCRFRAMLDSEVLDLASGSWRDGAGYAAEPHGRAAVHFVDGKAHVVGQTDRIRMGYTKALEPQACDAKPVLAVRVDGVSIDASTHLDFTTVNHVEHHTTKNVSVALHTDVDVDVTVLPFSKRPVHGFCGDRFFLRTAVGSRPTLSTADLGTGWQRLAGRVVQGQPTLPRDLDGAYAFHEGEERLFSVQLDGEGGFEVDLPATLRGPLLLFGTRDGRPTDAGVVDLG